jgi:hypothetical protein
VCKSLTKTFFSENAEAQISNGQESVSGSFRLISTVRLKNGQSEFNYFQEKNKQESKQTNKTNKQTNKQPAKTVNTYIVDF